MQRGNIFVSHLFYHIEMDLPVWKVVYLLQAKICCELNN